MPRDPHGTKCAHKDGRGREGVTQPTRRLEAPLVIGVRDDDRSRLADTRRADEILRGAVADARNRHQTTDLLSEAHRFAPQA